MNDGQLIQNADKTISDGFIYGRDELRISVTFEVCKVKRACL